MKHTKSGTDIYVLRIDRGEEVVKTITEFCLEEGIGNALFNGIGAVDQLKCGWYELPTKEYHFTTYEAPLEVVSLTGNVMLKEGKPFVHVHGVFTDIENKAMGGHIVEMRVGVVLEVVLTKLSTKIERVLDDCIGLALMDIK